MRRTLPAAAAAAIMVIATGCSGSSSSSSDAVTSPPAASAAASTRWVVSLGDSYIAGEGDRWAGNLAANSTADFAKVDALGPFAYAGTAGLEDIPGCHRATLPEVAVADGTLQGKNFACSGAETSTKVEGSVFKPGIDFYDHKGNYGQALDLQNFAKTHDVKDVVLSIGGNNFNFSTILTQCVQDFVATAAGTPTYCSKDPKLAAYFSDTNVAKVTQQIQGALTNIATAMQHAGKQSSDYRIIVQDYPSPLPAGKNFRYPQTTAGRFDIGGCPVFNQDADWANNTVLKTINATVKRAAAASGLDNITYLDLSRAFVGHRLCEKGVAQIQNTTLKSWKSPGAANQLEWINQVYVKGIPWQTQESAHPNYWGTAAERNCLRKVVTGPASATSLACVRDGTALTGREPTMSVVAG